MFNFGRLKVRTYSPPTILTEMILIDKLSFTKYYSVIIWLIIIVPCSIIFQGCEKEDYYSTDKDEIINSIEFEEFIAANIELVSAFQNASAMFKDDNNRKRMKIGVSPEGSTYRSLPFEMDENLLINFSTRKKDFMEKFPSFKTYEPESKKELIQEAMVISKPINKLLLKKGVNLKDQQLLRLKSGGVESSGLYTYSGYINALMYAMDWAYENQVECSGFLFAGGGAILYINPNAILICF